MKYISTWFVQRSGFDSRRYKIFWEVVSLELGPLSLMSTIEELLERKSSGSCLESREYGRRDPSRWPSIRKKLELTSPTSGDRSVGIVRLDWGHGVCIVLSNNSVPTWKVSIQL
jgi:hypothetical protein